MKINDIREIRIQKVVKFIYGITISTGQANPEIKKDELLRSW